MDFREAVRYDGELVRTCRKGLRGVLFRADGDHATYRHHRQINRHRGTSCRRGANVPQGEMGEIILRGACVMKGYHSSPEEAAAVIRDGWLYTGDLAVKDAKGYYSITGRKKSVILTCGINVSPEDVSRTIGPLPRIANVVAADMPNDNWWERVVNCVVANEPGVSAEDVISYCLPACPRRKFKVMSSCLVSCLAVRRTRLLCCRSSGSSLESSRHPQPEPYRGRRLWRSTFLPRLRTRRSLRQDADGRTLAGIASGDQRGPELACARGFHPFARSQIRHGNFPGGHAFDHRPRRCDQVCQDCAFHSEGCAK